ncbi:MAG: hemolysin III family protein [Bdellovibrionales bacterium]
MQNLPFWGFSDPFSSWTHLLAGGVALVGSVLLYRRGRGSGARLWALCIYSFSLVFLYSMSGVYHLLEPGGAARAVLQRLDHAGIWVLIAGTFTPVHVILFRGPWRWLILLLIWVIAITGLVLEVIFFTSFPQWLILTLFLGLGWMGVLTGYKFRTSFRGESLHNLLMGGICYSVGAIIDFLNGPTFWPQVLGAHEIFHIFVIMGSFYHWRFIYQWAAHPVANTITFRVTIFPHPRYVAEATSDHLRLEAESLDELKKMIVENVRAKYHKSIQPQIHLKYFQEETL